MIALISLLLVGFVLAIIGAYSVLRTRPTTRRIGTRRFFALCVLLGIALLPITFLCSPCIVSDGSYPQAEFRLIFKDPTGKPLEGVELRVEDPEGRNYFHYPVADYLPGKGPTSDRDGEIVFHHVPEGLVFGSKTLYWFGVIPVVEQRRPAFRCRFLRKGQEVYRVDFGELCTWLEASEDLSTVKRLWNWPVWPESQGLREAQGDDDLRDRKLRLFDLNGNGKLDPEEQAAFRAAANQADRATFGQFRGDKDHEQLEFAVIRKTIVVGHQ